MIFSPPLFGVISTHPPSLGHRGLVLPFRWFSNDLVEDTSFAISPSSSFSSSLLFFAQCTLQELANLVLDFLTTTFWRSTHPPGL